MANVADSALLKNIEGIRKIEDALVVLVKTEWNHEIVDALEQGCIAVLESYKIKYKTIVVPGAVEIPFAVKQGQTRCPQAMAFITLGCVIRGGTPHFEYVCQSVTNGITQLNLLLPVPVIFGVLTLDTLEQAKERTGGIYGHKGEEAAVTALKMIVLNKQLKEGIH